MSFHRLSLKVSEKTFLDRGVISCSKSLDQAICLTWNHFTWPIFHFYIFLMVFYLNILVILSLAS